MIYNQDGSTLYLFAEEYVSCYHVIYISIFIFVGFRHSLRIYTKKHSRLISDDGNILN